MAVGVGAVVALGVAVAIGVEIGDGVMPGVDVGIGLEAGVLFVAGAGALETALVELVLVKLEPARLEFFEQPIKADVKRRNKPSLTGPLPWRSNVQK